MTSRTLSPASPFAVLEFPSRDSPHPMTAFQSLSVSALGLFGVAYRMLGSAAEAEDIVQDVWLRWQTTDRNVVLHPPAFLATTTTRLAINHAQSARSRRETYIGPWLPEPVDTSSGPNWVQNRAKLWNLRSLLLLEKLSPTERAAYVLREAFNYPYRISRTSFNSKKRTPAN